LNIVLLTGGISAEREVSLSSGYSIAKGLREGGHNVKVVDPIYGDEDVHEEVIFRELVSKVYPSPEKLEEIKKTADRNIIRCINSRLFDNADIAFLGLHGKLGEDGRIQSLLELRGIKYTGSDVLSSAMSLDKHFTKVILKYNNVQTPRWMLIDKSSGYDTDSINEKLNNEIGFPFVIKPNDEGSTVGLSIVQPDVEDVQLAEGIKTAFNYSDKVLIEQYIKGRELTVPVIGDEAYPVVEIRPEGGFYDYLHKYTKGMTEYICPAPLDKEIEEKAKNAALTAHRSLGCSVYSRVDFMLDDNDRLYCLEVNTLPGMTETSLVPKSAKALGLSFSALLDKIIELSLNKK
jgi:D-alanine-D-alanine ligase